MRHTSVDVHGPVHVLDFGGDDAASADPVVLVHGLDGSAANWVDLGPALARDRRVVAYDLPGFGRTRLGHRRTSLDAHADLVVAATGSLLARPAVLVGNSMGAPVVLRAAARHPDAAAAVVLIAPAVPRPGTSRFDPSWLPLLATLWLPPLAWLEPLRRHAQPPERRVRALLDRCYAPGRRESVAAFDEMVAVAAARRRADQVRGWSGAARSLFTALARRERFHAVARRVQAPVLLLAGAADPIVPQASITATLARHPTWQHVALPGVGHVPPLEDPSGTAEALRAFLGVAAR